MVIFSRKKHKLPTYPKTIKKIFNEYCVNIDNEKVESLKERVLKEVEEAKKRAENGSILDVALGEEIANRCIYLLDHYNLFSPDQQKLIVGAVCYFAISDDPISEEIFASGYDDDAAVVNYVLEKLDITDMFIETTE